MAFANGSRKLTALSEETIEKIKQYRYDRIIEKHEGPEMWPAVLRFREPDLSRLTGAFFIAIVYHEWFVVGNPGFTV